MGALPTVLRAPGVWPVSCCELVKLSRADVQLALHRARTGLYSPTIGSAPKLPVPESSVSAALEEADLHLMLCLAASDRSRKRVGELLRSKGADGVMLMALREDDPLARMAEEAEMPVVFGGRPVGTVPRWYVDVDNVGGAREAIEYLVSRGRTRVATICGRLDTEAGRVRY